MSVVSAVSEGHRTSQEGGAETLWLRLGSVDTEVTLDSRYQPGLTHWIPAFSSRRPAPMPHPHIQFSFRVGTRLERKEGVSGGMLGPMTLTTDGATVGLSGPGRLGGAVDLDRRVGEVWTSLEDSADAWRVMHAHFRVLWSLALARCGLHAMHASGVVVDDGAVVIFGRSGAGKSTLAARMALAGGCFLSDDTIYAVENTGEVAGMGDTCRLRDSMLEGPAWVGLDPDGKHAVRPGTATVAVARPRILLFLDPSPAPQVECRPLCPGEAMVELIRSGLFHLDPATAEVRMRTLGRLAEECPSFRVSRGPEPPSVGMLETWMEAATR